jgi:tricorn protease
MLSSPLSALPWLETPMPRCLKHSALLCCSVAILLLTSAASAPQSLLGARYPALSPDGKLVAFEYWGDIWTAPTDGGEPARRLTDHMAWDYLPRVSPDGARIAFVSERSGNPDIWVVPAAGGAAQQVTSFSGGDVLCNWTPDGKELIFESNRGLWSTDLYCTAADGGTPPRQLTRLDHYNSLNGARLPDGGYLYARGAGTWWRKGYHGTAQYDLWRIFPDGHHARLTDYDGRDDWPALPAQGWVCYFVNNADGIDNLYSLDVRSGKRQQLTHYTEDGVQFPCAAADGKHVAYEWNGQLYVVATDGGAPKLLKLSLAAESKGNWVNKQSFDNTAGEFAVSPNGKYMVFIYAGDLWGIKDPKAYKDEDKPDQDLARAWRLTSTDGARERMPAFAKDNRHVAYVTDADGDYEVMVLDLADMSVKQVTADDVDDLAPQFDPANADVLFYYNGNRRIARTVLSTGETNTVAEGRFRQAFGYAGFSASPDGQWVAYVDELRDWSEELFIVDSLGKQAPVNISRNPAYDGDPQWSADGKWLLFRSDREGSRRSSEGSQWWATELNPKAEKYDLQFLFPDDQPKPEEKKEEAKPAALEGGGTKESAPGKGVKPEEAKPAEAKPEEPKSGEAKKDEAKPEEPKKEEPKNAAPQVVIDFDDIYLRAKRVTTQEGTGSAVISADGKWVVYECNPDGTGQQIWAAKVEGGDAHRINGGGWGSPVFADGGKRICYRDGGTLRYMKFSDGNNQGVEAVDAHGDFTLDKHLRWRQMYREGWRTMKEMFYDRTMHGTDWPAMFKKYEPLIEAAGTPEEFGLVFSELLGELNASHMGIYINEHSYSTTGKTTCSLGLEFDPAFPGPGLRVSHITYRGPADQPGVDIKEGDVLLSAAGQAVGRDALWQAALDDQQGQPVKLAFAPREGAAADAPQREVVIKPIPYSEYQDLLYREWERANEARVKELSNGRIGYIHIRGMSHGELDKFQRELFSELLDKDALLIDVRFNPGGFIHEELFDALDRNPFGYAAERDAPQVLQPARAFLKPKALLINARSGSDAEIFPAGWRALGLGRIVGIDTAGAVIGTSGFDLLDGTSVRLPEEGWWSLDKKNLEQGGTPPDVYVDVTPDELAAGKDAQLDKAVAVLLKELAQPAKE